MSDERERVLANPAAYEYVVERLGRDLAPTRSMFVMYGKAAFRAKHREQLEAVCAPEPVQVPLRRRKYYHVADLDRFIEKTRELFGVPA